MLGDIFLIVGSFMLALHVRIPDRYLLPEYYRLWVTVALTTVLMLVLLAVYGAYRDLHRPTTDTAASTIIAVVVTIVVAMAVSFFVRAFSFPRSVFFIAAALQAVLLSVWRLPFILRAKRSRAAQHVLVVANSLGAAKELRDGMLRRVFHTVTTAAAPQVLRQGLPPSADTVFVAPDVNLEQRETLVSLCLQRELPFHIVPRLHDLLLTSSTSTRIEDLPLMHCGPLGPPLVTRLLKRVIDVVGAVLLCILLTPALFLGAAAVWLYDRGPVLYSQVRLGQNMQPFTLYKLRTMIPDAERHTGPVLAKDGDWRVTPVGKLLRAARIDELPQLWNVLCGHMSLVGPRPERPAFVRDFSREVANYRLRFTVKPGITGLAQVLGRYRTEPQDKLRFDLLYVIRCTPFLDLMILLLTVKTVLFPAAAEGQQKHWVAELERQFVWQQGEISAE
jgi:exopolysaccharide biosynthesis polyprenyl glycosylphosphotransferase